MKHIYSDKMDESDEYLHQTISSHFQIIVNYIETLTSLSFAQNFDLEYLESSIMNLVCKPSTSIFLVSIIILLFFTQTFDFWLNIFYNRLPFKSITRNLRSGLGGSHLKNVIYELKANQLGVYAIQGSHSSVSVFCAVTNHSDTYSHLSFHSFRPSLSAYDRQKVIVLSD